MPLLQFFIFCIVIKTVGSFKLRLGNPLSNKQGYGAPALGCSSSEGPVLSARWCLVAGGLPVGGVFRVFS
jgi:hypothetical protein